MTAPTRSGPIEIYDTTLRDGSQGEGITFSVEDKIRIARRLDEIAMDFIEGGRPGSNPKGEIKIEVVVAAHLGDEVVDIALEAARTGEIGDGKIFFSTVEEAVTIRTGERGDSAL